MDVLAISDAARNTIALAGVYFVVFPALLHGLIGYAAAQIAAEREQNRRYREGIADE